MTKAVWVINRRELETHQVVDTLGYCHTEEEAVRIAESKSRPGCYYIVELIVNLGETND